MNGLRGCDWLVVILNADMKVVISYHFVQATLLDTYIRDRVEGPVGWGGMNGVYQMDDWARKDRVKEGDTYVRIMK